MTFNEVKDLIVEECDTHGVIFFHADSKTIKFETSELNGLFTSGYYDNDDFIDMPILAVGTNDHTLETMIHEYCHMKQYLEGFQPFLDCNEYNFIWEWVNKNPLTDQIPEDIINDAFGTFYEMELDAEKRSIELHIEWDTGIDIEEYIQKANAYTTFYLYVRENRSWYKPGQEPYNLEEVWKMMPKTFDFDVLEWYITHHKLFDLCVG